VPKFYFSFFYTKTKDDSNTIKFYMRIIQILFNIPSKVLSRNWLMIQEGHAKRSWLLGHIGKGPFLTPGSMILITWVNVQMAIGNVTCMPNMVHTKRFKWIFLKVCKISDPNGRAQFWSLSLGYVISCTRQCNKSNPGAG
jgi:hypothetical protein